MNIPHNMPSITGITSLESFRHHGHFLITLGIKIDYGDLTYNDKDAITELTMQAAPE